MSIATTSRYSIICVLLITIFSGFSASAQSLSSSSVATCSDGHFFGTRPSDGTGCIDRGVCERNDIGVNVTFMTSPDYPNGLIMSFSLSELQNKQPEQVAYFMSGSYMFDADYCLSTDQFYAPLNLPANSWILTTSNVTVQINGDVVRVYVMYSVVNN